MTCCRSPPACKVPRQWRKPSSCLVCLPRPESSLVSAGGQPAKFPQSRSRHKGNPSLLLVCDVSPHALIFSPSSFSLSSSPHSSLAIISVLHTISIHRLGDTFLRRISIALRCSSLLLRRLTTQDEDHHLDGAAWGCFGGLGSHLWPASSTSALQQLWQRARSHEASG